MPRRKPLHSKRLLPARSITVSSGAISRAVTRCTGGGKVFIDRKAIVLQGRLAPGPDYRLYLSPEFVETEADFLRIKPQMRRVGDVRTFENFLVTLPADVDPSQFRAVIVWCETFGQFITAARYR